MSLRNALKKTSMGANTSVSFWSQGRKNVLENLS